MTEYVVIGDGAAGTTTAQYIRKRDPDGRITIVSDDPNAAYYRAALTNYLIGELREDQLFAVPPDFYARNRIQRMLARVASIDTVARRITLTSGGPPVAYDRLCIAAGSTPNPPPFAGADLAGVMTMRTMQDARTFMEDLRSGRVKRAVVIGGGPLALEWAQGLRAIDAGVRVREEGATYGVWPDRLEVTMLGPDHTPGGGWRHGLSGREQRRVARRYARTLRELSDERVHCAPQLLEARERAGG